MEEEKAFSLTLKDELVSHNGWVTCLAAGNSLKAN